MLNGLLTLRGAWDKLRTEPMLKFMVVALTAYGMATLEGPMLAIKSVNSLSHYTDWTIAHVHTGALGWNGFLTFSMLKAGDLQIAEYNTEQKAGEEIKNASIAKFEVSMGSLEPSKDPPVLGKGQGIFMTYCAPCRRPDGGGLAGPSLCDDYWIHGSNYVDNVKTIVNGVPEKGMLTWRGVLKPSEIQAVASYIYTLRGTKPPNPKPREDQAGPVKPNIYE